MNWWEAVAYTNALSVSEGLEPCYTLEDCDPAEPGTDIECAGTTVSDPGADGNPYLCEGYRLPMEAEWEYAYRAGTTTTFYNGLQTQTERSPLDANLDAIAWYGGNSGIGYDVGWDCDGWYAGADRCGPHEVGGKQANAWGLFDMSGSVWEWLWDRYQPAYYSTSPHEDPLGGTGSSGTLRGGSWFDEARHSRAARREEEPLGNVYWSIGIRVARTAP